MKPASSFRQRLRRGFTLVEIMIAAAIGLVVIGAVLQTFVVILRLVHKNQAVDKAVADTRFIQAHLNRELAVSKNQTLVAPYVRPTYAGASPVKEGGLTYYTQLTYRVPIGSFATVVTGSGTSMVLNCPADLKPLVGDFIEISAPSLGRNCRITAVTDSRSPNTAGTISLTLDKSINQAQGECTYDACIDTRQSVSKALADKATAMSDAATKAAAKGYEIAPNTVAGIQRERRYDVVPSTLKDNTDLYEIRWYDTTISSNYVVLSHNIDPAARYLFTQIPVDEPDKIAPESGVRWRFTYKATATDRAAILPGSNTTYYQANYAEGLIMPKSGNPISSASYADDSTGEDAGQSTTTLGTSTTTAGTTTAGTTTAGSSTTTKGTTTKGTTTKGTTTAGTTTKGSSTTTKGSTTTAGTTTKGSSTTTKGSSTTTKGSTSTRGTTTAGTTTKGSTTTAGSSTTRLSTTTAGSSTTTKASTTTAGSTTTQGTTTTTIKKVTTTIMTDA